MDLEEDQDEEWAVSIFMLITQAAMLYRWILANNYRPRQPTINWADQREILYFRLFRDNDVACHDQLRIRIDVFNQPCCRLQRYGLQSSRFVPIEEQVAILLITVGHNHRNRCNLFQFFHSGQTISYYFHQVLNAIMRMYRDVVIPANGNQSPADANKDRGWEVHFEDAVGAIDGTHFFANVPAEDRARYRDRKGNITQNVLVACTFDLRFIYILAGWEGSAYDRQVLRCAVSREGHRPTPRGEGSSIPNIGKGKKRTRARALPDFVEINECFKSMVAAAQEMVANTKKTDYTKVNQALKDLNLSNRVLLLAMKLFTGNKDLPSAFLAIDSELRKSWLDLMIDGVIPEDIDHNSDSGWM